MQSARPSFWVAWMTVAVTLFVFAGCRPDAGGESPADAESAVRLRAVCTTGMVADLVRAVGGDQVNVVQLMGAGVDPHLYQATRDDIQAVQQADAIFCNGLMLEGKLAELFNKMQSRKPVYAVAESIDAAQLIEPDGSEGHPDPHVWMDVSAWSRVLDAVVEALSEQLPEHGDTFQERADRYRDQLAALHAYGKRVTATIPIDRRVLITSHDAFHYFGRAYDIEVQGIQGLSTEAEAGLQQINRLVDMLVERKIQAVFVESSVSRKNIQALIEGAASRGHKVAIGGELFSDAMGPAGTYEGTYVGMLDHNLTMVARALGGEVTEGGFRAEMEGSAGGKATGETAQ